MRRPILVLNNLPNGDEALNGLLSTCRNVSSLDDAQKEVVRRATGPQPYSHVLMPADVVAALGMSDTTLRRVERTNRNMLAGVLHSLKHRVAAVKQSTNTGETLDLVDGILSEIHLLMEFFTSDYIERSEFDLHQLIEEALDSLALNAKSIQCGHAPFQVCADRLLLRLVLDELLRNSMKFMPEGLQVVVSVTTLKVRNSAGPRFRLVWSDNGPGILKKHHRQIWVSGFRYTPQNGVKIRSQGHGLGLSFVKRVVELHGGKASADHQVQSGASFVIEMPHACSLGIENASLKRGTSHCILSQEQPYEKELNHVPRSGGR